MTDTTCENCRHCAMLSEDDNGMIVNCDINDRQMFSPVVDDCIHWEKAEEESID